MGIFGGRDEEWEAIKDEYRQIKIDIGECEQQISAHNNLRSRTTDDQIQYLVEENLEQDDLTRLGLQGWDLVNFASYTVGWGVGSNAAMKVHLRYIFKRSVGELSADGKAWIERLGILADRKEELASTIRMRGYNAD